MMLGLAALAGLIGAIAGSAAERIAETARRRRAMRAGMMLFQIDARARLLDAVRKAMDSDITVQFSSSERN
jgi:hypothetical protein